MTPGRRGAAWAPLLLTLVLGAGGCAAGPGPATGGEAEEALAAPGPGRLPRVAVPERYELDFDVDPRRERFIGRGTIALNVRAPTDRLWLHMVDLEPWRLEVEAGGRTYTPEVRPADDPVAADDGAVQLVLPETIPAGPARIVAAWEAPFADGLRGLYRARQGDRWFAYTQFEVGHARRAFPCLDEPDLKATFAIRVAHPEGMLAFSNAPEASVRVDRDTRTVQFAETPRLPTYLVALAVGPHDVVRSEADPRIRVVVPAGQASRARVALRLHEVLLAELEAWFGRPYPFEKLDALAAVEFAAGAMENAGLVIYREERLLVDPETSPPDAFRAGVDTIAHELAHQWFGNLVTPVWWDDLWLNEAFATWLSRKVVDDWRPSLDLGLEALMRRDGIMAWDSLAGARPIRGPVESLRDAGRAFGLVYGKGQALLDMLEAWIGSEPFRAGVQRYLDAHAWGNATADDLFVAVQRAGGEAVAPVARAFLDQAGVPAVALEVRCEAGTAQATLAQSAWRPGADADREDPRLWDLPVCLAWPGGDGVESRCVRLEGPTASVDLEGAACPSWVHPNAGEYGYYRWRVPQAMLPRLAEATAGDWALPDRPEATRRSRLALLDQAWGMVAVGEASPAAYAALAEGLARGLEAAPSPDPLLLAEVADAAARLAEVWPRLREDPRYAAWVRRVLGPAWDRLGPAPRPEDGPAVRDLRARLMVLLGEVGGDPEARDRATALAARWLEDPTAVPSGLAPAALWVAARTGAVDFAALRRALAGAERPQDRLAALAGLSRLPPGGGLEEALGLLLEDGAVRRQDGPALFMPTLSDPESRPVAFQFLTEHFEAVSRRLPWFSPDNLDGLGWVVAGFCDPGDRDRARAFLTDRGADPDRGPLAQGLEQADRCIRLREAGEAQIDRWLTGL